MRMWMINPRLLCRNHLLGEHNEIHKLVGCLRLNRSIRLYLEKGFLEPQNIISRHNQLANEMLRRNYQHKTPIDVLTTQHIGKVNRNKSVMDLISRCKVCKENISEVYLSTGVR